MTERGTAQKKEGSEVKTFTVPFSMGEVKENITINANTPSKASKEQIINQALAFHAQGKIKEAAVYYKNLIEQDCDDCRVHANFGSILNDLGKIKEAEFFTRKAIELNPKFAEA